MVQDYGQSAVNKAFNANSGAAPELTAALLVRRVVGV